MSRTLEPGISLLTAAEIRVVVLPIGPMPRDTFESYLEALNAHRHVPISATASFHQCGPKSPFPHLPYKTGAMHFKFMQAEDARRRSRVCDLHAQRNVVAVLGLLHCPLVEDLSAAHNEFLRNFRQWPEALVARCVAFEPSPVHLAAPAAKLQDLMIFPAGHLDQHLEVYMHEFAAAVLAAVEEHLLNANVSSVKLNTYVDSGDFLGSLVQIEEGLRKLNINEEEVKEKKRWGRLQKAKGDWSLLVGSPKDAFEHYKSAMELSRAAGDAIWVGAAIEGLAHARVQEALQSARLAASSGSSMHGRLGGSPSTRSSPVTPSSTVKAAAAAPAAFAADAAVDADPAAQGAQSQTAAGAAAGAAASPQSSGIASALAGVGVPTSPLTHDNIGDGAESVPSATAAVGADGSAAAVAPSAAAEAAGAAGADQAGAAQAAGLAGAAEAAASSEAVAATTSVGASPFAAAGSDSAVEAGPQPPAAEPAAEPAAGVSGAQGLAGAPLSISTTTDQPSSSEPSSLLEQLPAAAAQQAADALAAAASGSAAAATDRASSMPALQGPLSPTAAAATAAAAAQLARRRSVGSAAAFSLPPNYSLSGQAFCVMLASADLEGEVRELLAEARSWYKRKGGALPLQIEQSVTLCRLLACTAAGAAAAAASSSGSAAAAAASVVEALKLQLQREVEAAVAFVLESLPSLGLLEDKAVALAEAAQLMGLCGRGRKRLLLLWAALDLVRTGGVGPAAVAAGSGLGPNALGELPPAAAAAAGAALDVWGLLKLALTAMEPPDQPGQQDADDIAKVHWSVKRFIAWQQQHMQTPAAAAAVVSQQQSDSATGPSSSSSGSGSGAATQQQQQQPWQQQQFQQLLGPQLQLLTPAQAAALEAPCLLQQTVAKQRRPASPSKLGSSLGVGSNNNTAGSKQQQQDVPPLLQQQLGAPGVPIGVLAGLLNPCNLQQWMPGGGCLWDSLHTALLEVLVTAARLASAPVDAWEAAATLLREYYPQLPQALQSSLADSLAVSGAAMGTRLRARPGPGPGPQVQLKRIVPGLACLQPQYLSAALLPGVKGSNGSSGGSSTPTIKRGEGVAGSGPFIYDPYAAKRKGASAAAAAQAAVPEWVCGEEGRVELILINQCAAPLKLDNLQLQVRPLQQPTQGSSLQAAAGTGTGAGAGMLASGSTASGGSDSIGSIGSNGLAHQQQQQHGVSVMLAAGSKPLKVQLGYVPKQPGFMAITGVQATSKGVSWYQPFVQLLPPSSTSAGGATVAAAAVLATAGGRDAAKPQGCFTVLVQPQLPLIKASLQGAEVQITLPSEGELSALSGTSSSSSSSGPPPSAGTSWSSAGVWSSSSASAATAAGAAVGAARAEMDRKATAVVVFEGQTLTWTLHITNMSAQPITGCRVTVLNAKGAPLKPPPAAAPGQQQALLPPGNPSGALLEVQEQGLTAGLPLNPGASLSLPVKVLVGKPPAGNAFDASTVQLCITYHGTATSAGSSSDGSSEGKLLGRSLLMPIKLAIQPTIQVKAVRFLQQGVPLRNGTRDDIILGKPQRLLLQSLRESRDVATAAAAAAAQARSGSAGGPGAGGGTGLRRGASHHVRNNSEGSVPVAGLSVGPVAPLPSSPSTAGGGGRGPGFGPEADTAQIQVGSTPNAPSSSDSTAAAAAAAAGAELPGPERVPSPVRHAGVSARTAGNVAAAAAAAGGSLALGSEPVLELVVRNASERYFRTWLGCLPDRLTADSALSAVAVLEPGDMQQLAAVLPHTSQPVAGAAAGAALAGAAGAAGAIAAEALKEPPKLAAAEALVGRLVVCWEMITGAAASGVLPRGCVPLEALDVAANMTPVALAALCPAPLHLRLLVPPASAVPANQAPSHMIDLSALLARLSSGSASSSSSLGQASVLAAGQHKQAAGAAAGISSSGSGSWKLPGATGPLWGLHMKVGQCLVFDLEVSLAAGAAGSGGSEQAGSSSAQQQQPPPQQQLDLQVTLYVLDALSNSSSSSTTPAVAAGIAVDRSNSSLIAALLSGQSLGPRGFAAAAAAAVGEGRTSMQSAAADAATAAAALHANGAAAAEGLVDPGVFLTGCYNKLQVSVTAGGKHTCRMHALLVQPGLYVLGVADVQKAQQGGPLMLSTSTAPGTTAAAAAAGLTKAAGSSKQGTAADHGCGAGSRVYFSQDRLFVLVTR